MIQKYKREQTITKVP